MPNGVETIACGRQRTKNGSPTRTVDEVGKPVARTRAEQQAYQAAYEEAWATAKQYRCDRECPEMIVRIKLHTPQDRGCTEGNYFIRGRMQHGYQCKAVCSWELVIRCDTRKLPDPPHHHHAEDQRLRCDEEDEVADASGKVGPLTSNGETQGDAERVCFEQLLVAIKDAVLIGALQITCPDHCPGEISVVVGKPDTHCTPPAAGGNWTCTCECEWYVQIRCRN